MRKYARILVATDFSTVSESAASESIELAQHYGAKLIFFHVVEHFPEHLPHYRIAHEDMDPEEFILDRAKKDLDALCERLGATNAEREVRLSTHSAKFELVKFATENDVDLIIIGSRGRHSLIDALRGSTATGVVRAAPCDVFVMQAQES